MTNDFLAPLDLRAELLANRLAMASVQLEARLGRTAPGAPPAATGAGESLLQPGQKPSDFLFGPPATKARPPSFPSLLGLDKAGLRGAVLENSALNGVLRSLPPLMELPAGSLADRPLSSLFAQGGQAVLPLSPDPGAAAGRAVDSWGLAVEIEMARRNALGRTAWLKEQQRLYREAEQTGDWGRYYNAIWMHEKSMGAPNY